MLDKKHTNDFKMGLVHVHDRMVRRISLKNMSLISKAKVVTLLLWQMLSGKCLGLAIADNEICLLSGECSINDLEQPLLKIQDWASKVYISTKNLLQFESPWCLIFVKAPNKTWRQLIVKDDIVFYDRNLGAEPPNVTEEVSLAKSFLRRYGLEKDARLMVVQVGEELPNDAISLATLNAAVKGQGSTPFYILPRKLLNNLLAGLLPLVMKVTVCCTLLISIINIAPKLFAISQLYGQTKTLEKNVSKQISKENLKLVSIYRAIQKSNPDLGLILETVASYSSPGGLRSIKWENGQLTINSITPLNTEKLRRAFPKYKVTNAIENSNPL